MNNSQYICTKPFTWLELGQDGKCWVCCEAWQEKSIGNLLTQPFEEVWNGEVAQAIRKSMHDGDYIYCNDNCPFKKNNDGPIAHKQDMMKNMALNNKLKDAINNKLTVLPYKPLAVNAVYDRSCNLSCPSCRTKIIIAIGVEKNKILEIQERLKNEWMDDCNHLAITGSGDPFGSPYFRKFLQELDPEKFPELDHIHLHTNGILWTPESWAKLSKIHHLIKSTEISIDAGSPETYAINRRGGDWNKLMQNLEFISTLKELKRIRVSFVVQQNNWREMKDFVARFRAYGFIVSFSKLIDWGTWPKEELHQRQVHRPDHPEHKEFVKFIKDSMFEQDKVKLGNLRYLLPSKMVPLL